MIYVAEENRGRGRSGGRESEGGGRARFNRPGFRRRREYDVPIGPQKTVRHVIDKKTLLANFDYKLFGKYNLSEIKVEDPSLSRYICMDPVRIPHSHGRNRRQFDKQFVNVVERLANKLMRGGTGEKTLGRVIRTKGRMQGKKTKALRVVKQAFELVEKKTNSNPLQMLIHAIMHSAPREDFTRVTHGGVSYQISVDISALRRLDMALRNMALAAIMGSFNHKRTLADALADEIIFAAKDDAVNSFAVKKKNETERMARSAR